jgi:hypothetical protein
MAKVCVGLNLHLKREEGTVMERCDSLFLVAGMVVAAGVARCIALLTPPFTIVHSAYVELCSHRAMRARVSRYGCLRRCRCTF